MFSFASAENAQWKWKFVVIIPPKMIFIRKLHGNVAALIWEKIYDFAHKFLKIIQIEHQPIHCECVERQIYKRKTVRMNRLVCAFNVSVPFSRIMAIFFGSAYSFQCERNTKWQTCCAYMFIRLPNSYKNRLFTFAKFSLDRSTATPLTPNRRNCRLFGGGGVGDVSLCSPSLKRSTEHIFLVHFEHLFSSIFSGVFFFFLLDVRCHSFIRKLLYQQHF